MTLLRAHLNLSDRGWVMRDLPGRPWWVCRRFVLDHACAPLRVSQGGARTLGWRPAELSGDITHCALCMRRIRPMDVVVRLACGHVFHTLCHPGEKENGSGLVAWFCTGTVACPVCRAPLLGSDFVSV